MADIEYRVRQSDKGWHVDYHHGVYADTRATYPTREEAERDAEARRKAANDE